jgi:hypothetical protein
MSSSLEDTSMNDMTFGDADMVPGDAVVFSKDADALEKGTTVGLKDAPSAFGAFADPSFGILETFRDALVLATDGKPGMHRVFSLVILGNRMKTAECFYSVAFILLPMASNEFTKHEGVESSWAEEVQSEDHLWHRFLSFLVFVRLACRRKRCRHPVGVLPPHSGTLRDSDATCRAWTLGRLPSPWPSPLGGEGNVVRRSCLRWRKDRLLSPEGRGWVRGGAASLHPKTNPPPHKPLRSEVRARRERC